MTVTPASELDGFVAPGYEAVLDEFAHNFAGRGELGAAFAAWRDGEPLVDLWGGVADRPSRRRWDRDTLQVVFSGTKGIVAVCMLLLIDRGQLELDAPVARYWPEFAAGGKERVTVRDVVAHSTPVPGVVTPLTWQESLDASYVADLLAGQPASDDPRATSCYHAFTYGTLCGELVRRADGRTIGRYLAEEVVAPLELEGLWIGLPERNERRVSTVELARTWGSSGIYHAEKATTDPLLWSVLGNPARFVPPDAFPWNDRAWHAAEVPSSNAIATARSVARLYASLDRILSPAALELARRPLSTRQDPLFGATWSLSVGFQLQTEELWLGPPAEAFGHGGAGGSRHGCWPEQRVGFSYVMNLLRDDPEDRRGPALLEALFACVEER